MIVSRLVLLLTLLLAGAHGALACPSDLDQFGDDGVSETPAGLNGTGYDAVSGPGGTVFVAGSVEGKPGILRFTSAGDFDDSFGDAGVAGLNAHGYFYRLVLLGDGSILAAGSLNVPQGQGETSATVLARFTSTGEIDEDFGSDEGFTIVRFGDSSTARDLLVRSDGNIVVIGSASDGAESRATVFFFNSSGRLSPTLGAARALPGLSQATATSVAALGGNAIFIVGFELANDGGRVFLAKMNGSGALDASFGKNGIRKLASPKVVDEAWMVELDGDGRIYVGGTATPLARPKRTRLAVRRFLANGALDKSYGRRGKAIKAPGGKWNVRDMDVSDEGVVTMPAIRGQLGTNIARFDAKGVIDRAFGHLGVENYLHASLPAIDVPSNGKLILGGTWAPRDARPVALRFEGGEWDGEEPCVADCGDGDVGRGEQCDDGNFKNGDGCSAACLNE